VFTLFLFRQIVLPPPAPAMTADVYSWLVIFDVISRSFVALERDSACVDRAREAASFEEAH
jgi:hypothetical protein